MKFTKYELQDLEFILKEYIEFMKKAKRNRISRDGYAEYGSYEEAHKILSKITGQLTKEEKKRRQGEIVRIKSSIECFEQNVRDDKKRYKESMRDWKKLVTEKKNEIKKLKQGKDVY